MTIEVLWRYKQARLVPTAADDPESRTRCNAYSLLGMGQVLFNGKQNPYRNSRPDYWLRIRFPKRTLYGVTSLLAIRSIDSQSRTGVAYTIDPAYEALVRDYLGRYRGIKLTNKAYSPQTIGKRRALRHPLGPKKTNSRMDTR